MDENGITLEVTAPYTPEQNGLAERTNRTVIETLRSLVIQSKLPERLWYLLLPFAIQQINLSPKPNFGQQRRTTPHEELFGKPSPLYPKLRPCGTLV
jgi:transposase InsO family protein